MSCKGCPGTQRQVGEEQGDLAKSYRPDERTRIVEHRVNRCVSCGAWEGFWICSELMADSVEFRRRLNCPDCQCPLLRW